MLASLLFGAPPADPCMSGARMLTSVVSLTFLTNYVLTLTTSLPLVMLLVNLCLLTKLFMKRIVLLKTSLVRNTFSTHVVFLQLLILIQKWLGLASQNVKRKSKV